MAQNSILSVGKWFKVSVTQDGIYQIDYSLLKKLGAEPDKLNPITLKIYAYPTGMLPQPNSTLRQKDLQEISIVVTGEADGKFNTSDKIYFFGQGPDTYSFNQAKQTYWYEQNLYSDKNFYFITFGGNAGKRVSTQTDLDGNFPTVNQYIDFIRFEEDKENILHSGREWFGFEFSGSTTEATVQFDAAGIVENSPITMISNVMARAYEPITFKLSFNGVDIGTQDVAIVANTSYAPKGRMKSDTLHFNESVVSAAAKTTHKIKYQFVKSGSMNSIGWLDNFQLAIKRKLSLYGDQTIFTLTDAINNAQSHIEIETSADIKVWDITDAFNTKEQQHSFATNKISFGVETSSIKKYAIFNDNKALMFPVAEGSVSNQNLLGQLPHEMIMIAYPDFLNEAFRLAQHRLTYFNIQSTIVTPQQIFNEFSGGRLDVSAIRDFIRHLYLQSNNKLKFVLLFGRGSFDYKDTNITNTNFVPVYESRNSLEPLSSYSSDDYYGFMSDNEGEWSETDSFNHTLEIGVGRIPCRTADEAKALVDKLIDYDLNKKVKGQWKTDIVFTADDGDGNIHQSQSNQLANVVENFNRGYHAKKIFLDSYPQIMKSFGQVSPDARNSLFRAFEEGAAIVNFTGHGSEHLWMQEQMMDQTFVAATTNRYKYPFVITATCEFGRNDDPFISSSAEQLLLRDKAGAIGFVSTTRLVNSSTNFELNSDFYDAFLNKNNVSYGKPIGTVFKFTKNIGTLGIANRNFSLLGDPSMVVGISSNEIVITQISNAQNESVLKGLTPYSLLGEVRQYNIVNSNFTGEVEIRIFSKAVSKTTLGDENLPFQYSEFTNLFFQGKASVTEGLFTIQFTMPEIDVASLSSGEIIAYASSTLGDEAMGSSAVSISNINNPFTDNSNPTAILFMNDTTFVDGGITNENPFLIAHIEDDSGIDVSGIDSRNITAVLDGDTTFILNNYFQSIDDNVAKGNLRFQVFDLEKGKHQIVLTAFDLKGNKVEASVNFVVGNQGKLEISDLVGWPNPFSTSDKVKIGFQQNRSGEDLQGTITITNVYGKPIREIEFQSLASYFSTEILEWDGTDFGGSKVAPGVYILRLVVRSLADGSKNEAIGKLILTN